MNSEHHDVSDVAFNTIASHHDEGLVGLVAEVDSIEL